MKAEDLGAIDLCALWEEVQGKDRVSKKRFFPVIRRVIVNAIYTGKLIGRAAGVEVGYKRGYADGQASKEKAKQALKETGYLDDEESGQKCTNDRHEPGKCT